ncbi:symmetrical bis(5'-nucleosyl)-tetraphosphatase [Motiliproteus sediminis]|uniref:symmetrical bis(5'-nucleosyl)-tetraphosphatase n=1 Tax=Motiliproteus sediminis TaxID=1468178 RepID=UPI001AF025E3|nr:symmetrical bis(5'-nucleosyl)-tetraphosphatase [Motiliproteus sediminis]
MATYAIGDIQGCYRELCQLLDQIGFGDQDQLWLTGDLVNRGPDSLYTLRFVRELGARAVTVLGNHDLHLLAVAHGQRAGSKDTLDEILHAPDRDELLHWLAQQPLLHRDRELGYAMVHAGIPPTWKLKHAERHAREVETVIRSEQAPAFYTAMYGNTPACWSDDLAGFDRLRLITNYLTRMRFCRADGTLELKTKTNADQPPVGYRAWFEHPGRKSPNKRLIFGHWASLEGHCATPNCFALDTGCVWGGSLTALRLQDGTRFAVPSSGYA